MARNYNTIRKIKILKGKDLIESDTIDRLEKTYGEKIFFKTVEKDFSSVIPIELLKDQECAFYKALQYHLEKEFIVSEKVVIQEDKYGKKEYRCFVIDGEIANISRFTTDIFHEIEEEILTRLQEIVRQVKDVLPKYFVVDVFEYQKNDKKYIDVVEFNGIYSSGPYLYNSIMKKSEDLLHKNKRKISHIFMDTLDECMEDGLVLNERDNLYDDPKSFSHDLRNICLLGSIDGWCHDSIVSVEDFKRHEPGIWFGDFQKITDEDLCLTEKQMEEEWKKEGLSEEQIKLLRKMLNKNKGIYISNDCNIYK